MYGGDCACYLSMLAVCVCAGARVYLKSVVVITVSIKLKSYWKLFSFFVGAMSSSWGGG